MGGRLCPPMQTALVLQKFAANPLRHFLRKYHLPLPRGARQEEAFRLFYSICFSWYNWFSASMGVSVSTVMDSSARRSSSDCISSMET